MNGKTITALIVTLVGAIDLIYANQSPSFLKRVPAPKVAPILLNEVEYRVPNTVETEGVVQAWDKKSEKKLWEKKVYSTRKSPFLETDVQWVFIESMTLGAKTNELVIVNEKKKTYTLNIVSKRVK